MRFNLTVNFEFPTEADGKPGVVLAWLLGSLGVVLAELETPQMLPMVLV